MRFGRHLQTGSRAVLAVRTSGESGFYSVQIFVTNPRGWRAPDDNPAAERRFRAALDEYALHPAVVHATYLINLASPRDDFFEQSVALLRATLERAAHFGASSGVFHIGSHGGAGEEAGLERLAGGIRRGLEGTPGDGGLLLEKDDGGGGKLGYRFENLAAVLDMLPVHAGRLGVCLDTAHLWGAGFDIGTPAGAEQVIAEANRTIALQRVPVLHLDDTPKALRIHL